MAAEVSSILNLQQYAYVEAYREAAAKWHFKIYMKHRILCGRIFLMPCVLALANRALKAIVEENASINGRNQYRRAKCDKGVPSIAVVR